MRNESLKRTFSWLTLLPLWMLASSCCREASAQIKLEQTPVAPYQLWVGFVGAEVQADGTIKASVDSKPVAKTVQPQPRSLLILDEGYSLKDLEVESLPALEFVQPTLKQLDGNKIELKLEQTGRFRARAELDFGGKKVVSRFNFTIGEVKPPKPEPGPDPDPEPQPAPDTIPAGSWLTFIEETNDRYKFPHLATLQADKGWYEKMKAKGLNVGWYDVDAKEVDAWEAEAKNVGLPALLVIDTKGKVIKAKTVPPTVATIEEFVFGGAK